MPKLWSHQVAALLEARSKLDEHGGTLLWVPMRGGKTRITLELIKELEGPLYPSRALVLGPRAVIEDVWPDEVSEWLPTWSYVPLLYGTSAKRAEKMQYELLGKSRVIIGINYEASYRPAIFNEILRYPWLVSVYDECHKLQSASGATSKAARKIAGKSRYKIGMTGTPISNANKQLAIWGQYRTLAPHIFHEYYTRFRDYFTAPCRWRTQDVVIIGREGAKYPLKFIRRSEYLSRFAAIAVQIKPEAMQESMPTENVIRSCVLESSARKVYIQLERKNIAQLQSGASTKVPNILVKILRLQQIANGWIPPDNRMGSPIQVSKAKYKLLCEVLEELDEPVVVVCRFKTDLQSVRLAAEFIGRRYYEFSGARKERSDWINDQTSGAILGAQIQAAGEGIGSI